MNKTVTINISGIIFHIEEDAFEKLSKYLGTIKSYFKDSDGRDEIMADIESRIAEILKEKIGSGRQVVLMTDVEHVVSIMGKPEDYAGESETGTEENKKEEEPVIDFSKRRRRVFRDPDDKVLGGVCSGISNYFDIDPLWLRLALVIITLLGGAGFLIYIILWIVIPKAKTTAEKLEMKGEKVNINNIKRSVEEELEHLNKKGKDMKEDIKNFSGPENREKVKSGVDKCLDFIASVGTSFLRVFAKIIAVVLIIIGVVFIIALVSSVFGVSNFGSSNSSEWMGVIFNSSSEYDMAWIALTMILGIPFIMLVYGGFRLLLGIKERNRIVGISATVLWVSGLALGLYCGLDLATEFAETGRTREIVTVSTSSDTLILRGIEPSDQEMGEDDSRIRRKIRKSGNNQDWEFINMEEKLVRFGCPDISIEKAGGDSFQIEIIRYAQGFDKKDALNRARGINYQAPAIQDSIVEFLPVASFSTSDKWRAQDIKIIIRVPVGKSVFLSKSVKHMVYNIENVHDILDSDMLNHVWTMTEDGLNCGNCEGIDIHGDKVEIHDGEIHIKDGDREIHIHDGERVEPTEPTEPTPPTLPTAPTKKTEATINNPVESLFNIGVPFLGFGY